MDARKRQLDDAIRMLAEERARLQITIDKARQNLADLDVQIVEAARRKSAADKKTLNKKK